MGVFAHTLVEANLSEPPYRTAVQNPPYIIYMYGVASGCG